MPIFHGQRPILGLRFGAFAYLTDCSRIPETSWPLLEGSTCSCSTRCATGRTRRTSRSTRRSRRPPDRRAADLLHPHVPRPAARRDVAPACPRAVELAYDGAGRCESVVSQLTAIHFPDDPPPRWHQPVLALGNFDGLHRGHMKIIDRVRRRAGERGGTPAAMTFDPHPPRVLRPDKAPPLLMTTDAEARGARPRRHAGRRRRPLHARAVALGSRDVRPHRARRVAARRRGLGRREFSVRPRSRRHVLRAADASARATASAPRRSIPSATRTSSSAARASGGWSPRGASTRRRRCSAITTSSTAPSTRGAGRGREHRVSDGELCTENELVPPSGRLRHARDGRRRRPSVGHEHRPASDVRRRRSAGRSRRTSSTSTAISTAPTLRLSFVQRLRDERAFPDVDALRAQIEADCRSRAAAVRPHFAVESFGMSQSPGASGAPTWCCACRVPAGGGFRAVAVDARGQGRRVCSAARRPTRRRSRATLEVAGRRGRAERRRRRTSRSSSTRWTRSCASRPAAQAARSEARHPLPA